MLGMYVFKNSTMYKKEEEEVGWGGGVNETVVYFIKERSLDTLIKILHTKNMRKRVYFHQNKNKTKNQWHNPHSSQNLANRH